MNVDVTGDAGAVAGRMVNNINLSLQKQKLIAYIAFIIFTLTVFWQVYEYDFFLIDDDLYVTQNIHIQSGITPEGIHWAFSTIHADYYMPLVWSSVDLFRHTIRVTKNNFIVHNLLGAALSKEGNI